MMAPANILNLLSENRAMHLPSLRKILSEVLCYFLTGISLEQYGHFQLVCGKEYPSMSKMRLNFQSTKMRPTSMMSKRMCWDDYGTGSSLQTEHWGSYWEGMGLLYCMGFDIILVRFYFLLNLLIL